MTSQRNIWFIRNRCVFKHAHSLYTGMGIMFPLNSTLRIFLVLVLVPIFPFILSELVTVYKLFVCFCSCLSFVSCFVLFCDQIVWMKECIKHICLLFLSPVDHTRVKLTLKTTNQDTDYINANFIKVKTKSNCCKRLYWGCCVFCTVHRTLLWW